MNKNFLEMVQVASGFVPGALTTAQAGGTVSLKNYGRCLVLFFAGAGTAGDDPTITLFQNTNVGNSPADQKHLTFAKIYVKQGASLGAVDAFTEVVVNGFSYTDPTSAEVQKIWAIDVPAETLDVNNGFCCISASIGDVGTNVQLGSLLYLLYEPKYAAKPSDMQSALAD